MAKHPEGYIDVKDWDYLTKRSIWKCLDTFF
jgi:hypothetical protein